MENTRKILAELRPSVGGIWRACRRSPLSSERGVIDFWGLIGLICILGVTALGTLMGAFECGMGPWSKHFC